MRLERFWLLMAISLSALAPTVLMAEKIVRCGTAKTSLETARAVERRLAFSQLSRPRVDYALQATTVIPIVFHVISSGALVSQGNVADATLASQVSILNSAYRGSGSNARTRFQFVIQQTNRVENSSYYSLSVDSIDEIEMKSSLRVGGAGTLNVYLVGSATAGSQALLGYSTLPWQYESDPDYDGIVVDNGSLPGGDIARYDRGDTLVHEVGHWLGLYHPFDGACSTRNDRVSDTPAMKRAIFGCPAKAPDTCPKARGRDPLRNFMGYEIDRCLTKFSAGQATRMSEVVLEYRGF